MRAFRQLPLVVLSIIFGGLGGAIGLIVLAVTEQWVSVWWGIVVGLYVAVLTAYRQVAFELEQLRSDVAQTRNARPQIVFEKVGGPTDITLANGGDVVEVWQIWFVNRPVMRTSTAIAQQLAATIEFCDDEWRRALDPFTGQWATTKMPDHVGWTDLRPQIDLSPAPTRGKLMLLQQTDTYVTSRSRTIGDREVTTREVYALAGENLHAYPKNAAHPKYHLAPGVTRVRVVLTATNMEEQEFRFRIDREEDGTVKAITQMT